MRQSWLMMPNCALIKKLQCCLIWVIICAEGHDWRRTYILTGNSAEAVYAIHPMIMQLCAILCFYTDHILVAGGKAGIMNHNERKGIQKLQFKVQQSKPTKADWIQHSSHLQVCNAQNILHPILPSYLQLFSEIFLRRRFCWWIRIQDQVCFGDKSMLTLCQVEPLTHRRHFKHIALAAKFLNAGVKDTRLRCKRDF